LSIAAVKKDMSFFHFKALHIIFVITWFAGLFYIVRLFIYHSEAEEKSEPERGILQRQFKIMQSRLWYGITWPSSILAIGFGLAMLPEFLPLKENTWMAAKLGFVLGLFLYHLYCHKIFLDLQNQKKIYSSTFLRIWNEVATLFLFAIVFLVVLKSILSMGYGLLGLVLLSIVLMAAIKVYKKARQA
jgi:putative membrane protein